MTLEQAKEKIAQAYQVIGVFVHFHDEGESTLTDTEILRAQDYFSDETFDPEFLPWPKS